MHLNQIHSFLAVSKTLNFTGAARQLGVPQSTISRQINDLESQLGVRLFYRTKRDVQITEEGRIFLPYAQEMADAARKGAYAVRQLHEGGAGRLSIAVTDACRPALAAALAVFHEAYPDIRVDLTPLSAGESLMDDTDAPYDFWFLYREMLLDPENYEYLHLERQPLCVARRSSVTVTAERPSRDPSLQAQSPRDFAVAGQPSGNPSPQEQLSCNPSHQERPSRDPSLQEQPSGNPSPEETGDLSSWDLPSRSFILMSEEADPILYMQTMNYCRTHRFTPKVINTFEEVSSVLLSVSAGLGVTVLPQSLINNSPGIDSVPLPDESYSLDCLAAWKASLLNPAASLFLRILQGH